jgi:tRNA threonylcarbamoyl adenosine modification protein YeaZ
VLLLAVDASTSAGLASVLEVEGAGADGASPVELAGSARLDARRSGELLAPAVADALAGAGVRLRDLDGVVVGLGPGPFTSLRVGVMTAAALADGGELPVYGVCSLDAVGSGPRVVVTDARRREVYWAGYDEAGTRTSGPAVDRPADLAARLAERGAVPRLVGAAAAAVADGLGVAASGPEHPDGPGLVRAAAAGGWARPALTPLYLRRPDAVAPGTPKPVLR